MQTETLDYFSSDVGIRDIKPLIIVTLSDALIVGNSNINGTVVAMGCDSLQVPLAMSKLFLKLIAANTIIFQLITVIFTLTST